MIGGNNNRVTEISFLNIFAAGFRNAQHPYTLAPCWLAGNYHNRCYVSDVGFAWRGDVSAHSQVCSVPACHACHGQAQLF